MTTTKRDIDICNVQDRLLQMAIGKTTTIRGVAVTRWGKDAFEVTTWGRSNGVGSETAAEQILSI